MLKLNKRTMKSSDLDSLFKESKNIKPKHKFDAKQMDTLTEKETIRYQYFL